jgi:hypothetical protein
VTVDDLAATLFANSHICSIHPSFCVVLPAPGSTMSTEIKAGREISPRDAVSLSVPLRPGVFQEIDRLSEMTTAMADLLIDLLETGTHANWTAQAEEVAAQAEDARRKTSRGLSTATGFAFKARILQLVRAQWVVFRMLRKVGTRFWSCADARLSEEARTARDGALMMSAITSELRRAIRCFVLPGRRPEARGHCAEVRRLGRGVLSVQRPLARTVASGRATDLVRVIAWDDGMALLAHAAEASGDLAELLETVVAEA